MLFFFSEITAQTKKPEMPLPQPTVPEVIPENPKEPKRVIDSKLQLPPLPPAPPPIPPPLPPPPSPVIKDQV